MAARGRPLTEVLGDAALQVLHGGGGSHADDPRVFESLPGCQTLTGVHSQHTVNEVLRQVGYAGPWLTEIERATWKA